MAYLSEFDTHGLSPEALAAWAAFERAAGRGFGVNSAYRDPAHNASVGGARNSQHTHGNAFDLDVSGLSPQERVGLINLARQVGFGGIGVYDNALHFDVGPTRHWGPDYSSGSLPSWAAEAVNAPRGVIPEGHYAGDGHDHSGQVPANALAAPQQPATAPQNALATLPPPRFRNSLNAADFHNATQFGNALSRFG